MAWGKKKGGARKEPLFGLPAALADLRLSAADRVPGGGDDKPVKSKTKSSDSGEEKPRPSKSSSKRRGKPRNRVQRIAHDRRRAAGHHGLPKQKRRNLDSRKSADVHICGMVAAERRDMQAEIRNRSVCAGKRLPRPAADDPDCRTAAHDRLRHAIDGDLLAFVRK